MAIIDCLIFRHHQSHSHQIQRQCIAKYLNCKESAIHISRIGKPILTSHPSTHFSVSHTNTHYFICFSNSPIGCDIESKNRPICPQYDRAFVVGALSCVDFIIIFDEDTPEELIKKIEPDVLVKGSDYNNKFIAGADFMLEKKKRVELVNLLDDKSTTDIISRIKKQGS